MKIFQFADDTTLRNSNSFVTWTLETLNCKEKPLRWPESLFEHSNLMYLTMYNKMKNLILRQVCRKCKTSLMSGIVEI